jgi:Uncharacterised nucleotidyltransferase
VRPDNLNAVDELIVRALRRERVAWPADATDSFARAILAAAADHGVLTLLAGTPAPESWPSAVRTALHDARRAEAAAEAIRREELIQLLAALTAHGIRGLLLKGAQIAYTHYPRPWLRPRLDTDLLVAPSDRTRANDVLRRMGYLPETHYSGDLVTHQFQFHRSNRYGLIDRIDLHWKIANPHVFADAFTFEELDAHSTPVPALGPDARGLSDAHALVLACIHRVAHHDNSQRLIWLYDIHLLAERASAACRAAVLELAASRRLRSVCAQGLHHARDRFATTIPPGWLEQLDAPGADIEPAAAFLQAGRRPVDTLLTDLRALGGWKPRLKLLREHVIPPPAYMRQAYGVANPLLLPFTYTHRVVAGMRKWFRRS